MRFGYAIKRLRKLKGYSQEELAEKAGLSQAHVSQIEAGNKRPGEDSLDILAKVLETPIPIIIMMAVEKEDVPPEKQFMYEKLMPVIKSLLEDICGMKTPDE